MDLNWSEELTTQQRQSLLIIELTAEEEIKTEALANQYKVGISTIQLDLQAIEETLKAYHIDIQRKKAVVFQREELRAIFGWSLAGWLIWKLMNIIFFKLLMKKNHFKIILFSIHSTLGYESGL